MRFSLVAGINTYYSFNIVFWSFGRGNIIFVKHVRQVDSFSPCQVPQNILLTIFCSSYQGKVVIYLHI